jgi:RNA polymerase sigma-70 factor (ECF subfamily)
MAPPEDVEAARAAARGDRAAQEAILRRLLPRVRNLVRYLVRGDDEVDDIAQNALTALLQGLPGYRGDAPLERWADRIVARETFRHLRRVRLRAARERPDEVSVHRASAPGPTDARFLERRALASALDALPEAQRAAVVLHHVVGLTVPDIAELLEVPADTAKSRLRLGMARLRARLRGEAAS